MLKQAPASIKLPWSLRNLLLSLRNLPLLLVKRSSAKLKLLPFIIHCTPVRLKLVAVLIQLDGTG